MVQIKFAVFAIIVLSLWIGHLYVLAPPLSARAVDAAMAHATAAPASLEAKLDEQRRELQRLAVKAAASGALAALQAARAKNEAPAAEKFVPFRDGLVAAVPEALRDKLVVGLANELGNIYSSGRGKALSGKSDLDLGALVQSGSDGVWQDAFGTTQVFFSFPIAVPAEAKPIGFVVVGFPLATGGLLESAAKRGGLDAIALLRAGQVVSIAGPHRPRAEEIDRNITPGRTAVAQSGSINSLGPFKFPIATNGDPFGGRAPLWIASRQAVASTPYEVIGLITVRPFMQALGNYQRLALLGFVVILGLSLVGIAIIGAYIPFFGGEDDEPRAVLSAAFRRTFARASGRSPTHAEDPSSIDQAPPWAGKGRLKSPPPPIDSLNGAGGAASPAGEDPLPPDATRVASIPEELLRESAYPTEAEPTPLRRFPDPPPSARKPSDPDEDHFREVFDAFVSTRAQCGESADGINYQRFATKLRTNRDQLVQKYNCRTVRFQVYVKDGKAALKATPVRA
jgi:hypothetical protein